MAGVRWRKASVLRLPPELSLVLIRVPTHRISLAGGVSLARNKAHKVERFQVKIAR